MLTKERTRRMVKGCFKEHLEKRFMYIVSQQKDAGMHLQVRFKTDYIPQGN